MKYLALLLLVTSFPCVAQVPSAHRSCLSLAHTQVQIDACANKEANNADSALNAEYQKLLAEAADEPEATAKIKLLEQAWIAYRDAYMNAMYPAKDKQTEYGSLYPTEASLLRAKLTRRQIQALDDLLKQYGSGPQ